MAYGERGGSVVKQWIGAAFLGWAILVRGADPGPVATAAKKAGIHAYDPARMHAVVIGIDAYEHVPALRCAAGDARAVAEVLRRFYGFGSVRTLIDEQASRVGILRALDACMKLTEDDSLLIYYAGHGWMDPRTGSGYWIPVDARQGRKADYVSNARIVNEFFRRYRVRHLLVTSDSCFAGALLRGGEPQRAKGWKLPVGFGKRSRWVLTSGDLAPVPDGKPGGHSPFARRLLQYLKESERPVFGVQDLYVHIRDRAGGESIANPLQEAGHVPGGEFVFARLGTPLAVDALVPAVAAAPALQRPQLGKPWTVPGLDIGMMPIRRGAFIMGSPSGEPGRQIGESRRRVAFAKPFWMARHELTQQQFQLLTGMAAQMDERDRGKRLPVTGLSAQEAEWLCQELTKRERDARRLPAGYAYRLPTEVEWEYCCRAGTTTAFFSGEVSMTLLRFAWFERNSADVRLHEVGTKEANPWGLHDMHGNAWELCRVVEGGGGYVGRGGSSLSAAVACRSAFRGRILKKTQNNSRGFRLVLGPARRR